MSKPAHEKSTSRREFLAAAGAVSLAAGLSSVANIHAQGNDVIKVGLIGCGGRGTGAAEQCVNAGPNVQLIALADLFPDHLQSCRSRLQKDLHEKFSVKEEYCFTGWNAHQQLCDLNEIDPVLLATPP